MPQKAKRKSGTIVEQFRAKLGTRDYAKRRRVFFSLPGTQLVLPGNKKGALKRPLQNLSGQLADVVALRGPC